eukprot:scaffold206695_cov50-Attheya_sp.AAC.1
MSWGSKTTLIIVKNGTINNDKITVSVKFALLTDHPVSRRLGSYGVIQSTGQVQRGHFQSKNHVNPSWRSKTTLIILKNGNINNVWGLMDCHIPRDR